jgi:hypothetical protein
MRKILSILSIITISVGSLIGQSIVTTSPQYKSAILEEFTGIHCTYCPDGHLIGSTLYNNNPNRVVLINIHTGGYATPSAGEPDFQTTWGAAIAGQTGLTGYPAGSVNRHPFATAMTAGGTASGRTSWTTMADEIMQEVSPVNVGATSTFNSTTNELTIDVEAFYTSNSSASTNYLNVALIQDSLLGPQTGGTNYNPTNYVGSDYVHSHMLRDLITGQWGDVISTTTQGSLYQNQYVYTVPADVNGLPIDVSNCHIVVFVTESTQEIYTGVSVSADGGSNDGNNAPFIGDFNGLVGQGAEGTIGSPTNFSFSIDPLIAGTNDYNFELTSDQPGDWSSSYSVNGSNYSTNQTISLSSGSTTSLGIEVFPGTTAAVSSYTLTMYLTSNPIAVQNQKVFVISGVTDLIVNGSGNNGAGNGNGASDYQINYRDGLGYSNNTTYDITSANTFNIFSDNLALNSVNNVYYNIGWTFPSLADADANSLATFLDNGGNLFVAGQDIGWDIESGSGYGTPTTQNFYTNYLNTSYVDDGSTANSQYSTVTTDNVFGSNSSSVITDPYGGYMYPDQLNPINGAQAIFNYNGDPSKVGATRFENSTYKVVYLGISLEMVDDQTAMFDIIKTSHDWFYGIISSDEMTLNDITKHYPNPASNKLNITSSKNWTSYEIYNLNGKLIEANNLSSLNSNNFVIDLTDYSNGSYSISLSNGSDKKTMKFVVVK